MLFYAAQIEEDEVTLDPQESHHCIKSLRKSRGEHIEVTDGCGMIATGEISVPDARKCKIGILQKRKVEPYQPGYHIAIAPTKSMDRIGWFVEKATEIGIGRITFFYSQNSERRKINLQKMQNKAVSAMKQSGQAWLPEFREARGLKELFDTTTAPQRFIAHLDETAPTPLVDVLDAERDAILLVGPEGDFTAEEVKLATGKGFIPVALGETRLRTETAGVVASTLLRLGKC